MNYFQFLLWLFLISACSSDRDEVIGHWHLTRLESNDINQCLTMDVMNDSIAFLNLNSITDRIKGVHRVDEKYLLFPGQCGSGHFSYKVIRGKIYLKGLKGYGDYTGERHGDHLIDLYQEFMCGSNFDISLPSISGLSRENIVELDVNFNLMETIILGNLDYNVDLFKYSKTRIGVDGQVVDSIDLVNWLAYKRENYPNESKPITRIRLMADRLVDNSEIVRLQAILREVGIKEIYISCLRPNYHDASDMFEYILFNEEIVYKRSKLYQILEN